MNAYSGSYSNSGSAAALVLGCALGLAGCELAELPAATGSGICGAPEIHVSLSSELEETSGVAASRAHRGIFWSHNDSGDDPLVYAVDTAGVVVARVRLEGATNRDWEDIAIGPCEGGVAPRADGDDGGAGCIFVADIGDNNERHDRVAFYRFPEPDPARGDATVRPDRIRASYPGGPRDAEAVFVTKAGIHVVNKGRSHAIELFRLAPPYATDRTTELERVQQIAPPPTSVSAQVTAAASSRDGRRAVIRTYSGLRFYAFHGDTLVHVSSTDLVVPRQRQGEAVDWVDEQRLVLTSEEQGDDPASLAILACDPDRSDPADERAGTGTSTR